MHLLQHPAKPTGSCGVNNPTRLKLILSAIEFWTILRGDAHTVTKDSLVSGIPKCGFLLLNTLVGSGDTGVAEIHRLSQEKCGKWLDAFTTIVEQD